MRGDQLSRQWRILRSIEASVNGLTVAEIADQEEVSIRTAYRDIETLEMAGFPLYCEKIDKTRKWFFVDTYTFKLPEPFTRMELMSLYFYSDLVRVLKDTPFYDSLESLFKKIRSTLPPETINYLNRVQSVFHAGIKPYSDYGRFKEMLNQINHAVLNRLRVEIAYRGLKDVAEMKRKVDPYKVWFFNGTMYLIGFCHLRGDVRIFVLDRIKVLVLLEEKFREPSDFSLDVYFRDSFRVMQDELYEVSVMIAPEWSRYVKEKIWHESQHIKDLPDGSIIVSFKVAGLDEICRWVLSLGSEAYVKEPEELRHKVKTMLQRALSVYETPAKEPFLSPVSTLNSDYHESG